MGFFNQDFNKAFDQENKDQKSELNKDLKITINQVNHAYLLSIKDIINSNYIVNTTLPDCIRFNNINVFKVMFTGFVVDVVDKDYFVVDDGTSSILIYNKDHKLNHLEPVLILGRIRLNIDNTKLIFAYFIRKININILKFYKNIYNSVLNFYNNQFQPEITTEEKNIEKIIKHNEVLDVINDLSKVFNNGVPKSDVINELTKQGYHEDSINKIILELLQKGEIFEIKKDMFMITKDESLDF